MFICMNILVVLPEFSYRITVKQRLSTMVALKTSRSMETYQEMAEYYGTAIIPARVRAPKDKPNAEGTVGIFLLGSQQLFGMNSSSPLPN